MSGTLTYQYLTVGALVRGTVKDIFMEVEKHGGTATYREHKRFLETTLTHVKLTGPEYVIRWAYRAIKSLEEE